MLNWEQYLKGTETGTTISMQLDKMDQQVIVENRKYIISIMEAILSLLISVFRLDCMIIITWLRRTKHSARLVANTS